MNRAVNLAVSLPKTCVRRLSGTEVKYKKADLTAIKKKQLEFQKNEEVPIFLRGGIKDKVLFSVTVVLTLTGLGGGLSTAYDLATKK